jgi:hypothetical protein
VIEITMARNLNLLAREVLVCVPKRAERRPIQPVVLAPAQETTAAGRTDLAAVRCQEVHDIAGNAAVGRMMAGLELDAFEMVVGAQLGAALAGAETEGLTGSNQMMLAKMRNAKQSNSGGGSAGSDVLRMVASSQGRDLPEAIARRMSAALGHDFLHVQIHTDADAAKAAQGIGAKAFAQGSDVYFDTGEFQPGTAGGDKLLAHELSHVVQHDQGRVPSGKGAQVSKPSDGLEREADAMAARALNGHEANALDDMVDMVYPVADIVQAPLLRQAAPGQETEEACDDEERLQFFEQLFAIERFVPSYGGCFDAEFAPRSNQTSLLAITLRLSFSFEDQATSAGPEQGPSTWTEEDSEEFIQKFVEQAQDTWSSKFFIACAKPGWEDIIVEPRLTILQVEESDNPHYKVEVCKMGDPAGNEAYSYVNDTDKEQGGGVARFFTEDVEPVDKLYPAVPVYVNEMREQLSGHTVSYLGAYFDSALLMPFQERVFLKVAAILSGTNEPSHTPTVLIEGWSGDSSQVRIYQQDAKQRLMAAGVVYPIQLSPTGSNEARHLSFDLAPQSNFQTFQVTANHEVGHMLGSPDHYREGRPDLQEQMERIIESEGLHDIARNQDTDSIMNVGNRVLPPHFIPFKEALAEMTQAFIKKDEWQIG